MPYPTTLPFAEIKRTANYFKEGTVKENIKQVVADLYEIEGYIFGTFIGVPPSLSYGSNSESVEQDPRSNVISVNVSIDDKKVLAELDCLQYANLPQGDRSTSDLIPVNRTADGKFGKLDITKVMEIAFKIYEMLVMFDIIPKPKTIE